MLGQAKDLSPEPMNTDRIKKDGIAAAPSSKACVHGFRALRNAKPRNDGAVSNDAPSHAMAI